MVHEIRPCLAAILRIEGYDRLLFKWWWLCLPIIALMVLLACWRLTVQLILWWRMPRSNPGVLFRQLARIHSLTYREKALISRMHQVLPKGAPTAILFADPSIWAWKQINDPVEVDALEKLYLKIFGFPRDDKGT